MAPARIPGPGLRKEAYTMALYVAVCLFAELTAVADHGSAGEARAIGLIWGTTVGLAVAHWFAFRISARLVSGGTFTDEDAHVGLAQLVGAAGVAFLVTVPLLVLPASSEFDLARLEVAAIIAAMGYAVGRHSGATRIRAAAYATGILVLGLAIAIAKNHLAGH